jgi:thermolysin
MQHRRYTQYYRGIEVLGGQIIQHVKGGRLASTTGVYYEAINIDTTPLLDRNSAIQVFRIHLARPEEPIKPDSSKLPMYPVTDRGDSSKLIIYPVTDQDYRLAYQVIANNGYQFSMTGILDAKTGEIIREYSNIQTQDLTIGVGTGIHGQQFKLPTTYLNSLYWLADESEARPVNQYTVDWSTDDVASDVDNDWVHDGSLVNVHAYLGLTYDYYYSVFGRHGIDDANLPIISIVHDTGMSDNASWFDGVMSFYDPGAMDLQMAAALDVISHEYSHGITQYTSGLQYYCDANAQPGALNESFSDIMGTAVEAYWQSAGQGFDRSDWVIGEDIYSAFSASNYGRSLSDPNSKVAFYYQGVAYPYPCHLSQWYVLPDTTEQWDNGGVHWYSTLYSHAYYLLAAGGTNRVSGLNVTGIGIDKATKIFFRAWTYYLTPTANILQAANALAQSAYDLYGGSSNEYTQTLNAMVAIGWSLN